MTKRLLADQYVIDTINDLYAILKNVADIYKFSHCFCKIMGEKFSGNKYASVLERFQPFDPMTVLLFRTAFYRFLHSVNCNRRSGIVESVRPLTIFPFYVFCDSLYILYVARTTVFVGICQNLYSCIKSGIRYTRNLGNIPFSLRILKIPNDR